MLPDFIIAGAARSGTTTVFEALRSHPETFMPAVKEPQFFSHNPDRPGFHRGNEPYGPASIWTQNQGEYESYFEDDPDPVQGEASVSYLYSPDAPGRIAETIPEAKIIIQLRHPVDRAYSHYLQLVRDGREELSFREALDREQQRIEEGWEWFYHYKQAGHYGDQLERYLDAFAEEQLKIIRYDRFDATPDSVLSEYLEFIGLANSDDINIGEYNVSGNVWSERVARWLFRPGQTERSFFSIPPSAYPEWLVDAGKGLVRGLRSLNRRSTKRSLEPELYDELLDYFQPQIEKLDELLDEDFDDWLHRDNLH